MVPVLSPYHIISIINFVIQTFRLRGKLAKHINIEVCIFYIILAWFMYNVSCSTFYQANESRWISNLLLNYYNNLFTSIHQKKYTKSFLTSSSLGGDLLCNSHSNTTTPISIKAESHHHHFFDHHLRRGHKQKFCSALFLQNKRIFKS